MLSLSNSSVSATRAAHGRKAILVMRRTRMDELIAQYNTVDQAAFVINRRGGDFDDYRLEHTTYHNALNAVEGMLKREARVQRLERDFLPNFIFGPQDIIVVVGQDGLVANTLKYLNGQPVLAINPDPKRHDGVLLPFMVKDTKAVFLDILQSTYQSKQITMIKATLNDGQELIAVNDLFIGPRLQLSARYRLTINSQSEEQSSSGIIVSTGLGTSGWLKSVIAGAEKLTGAKGRARSTLAWDADCLTFVVREPFPSQTTGTELVFGEIDKNSEMMVTSQMAGNGVIFSDGMVEDCLTFNSGVEVTIGQAENKGHLLI